MPNRRKGHDNTFPEMECGLEIHEIMNPDSEEVTTEIVRNCKTPHRKLEAKAVVDLHNGNEYLPNMSGTQCAHQKLN